MNVVAAILFAPMRLVSGIPRSLVDQKPGEEPEWLKKRRAKLARKQKSKKDDFDEEKFLGVDKKGTENHNCVVLFTSV